MTPLTYPTARLLTADLLEQYNEEGYFVIPNLFDATEVQAMLDECDSILRGDFGDLFKGATQKDPGSTDAIQAERKISAVVERSRVFRHYLLKDALVERLKEILGDDILLFRDILMLKPAFVGSKMPWHQDSNYWPIVPHELCSVWTALDPATSENGCMQVIPRSHRIGIIPTREGSPSLDDDQIELSKAIEVPMEPGSSLFFHSRLLHGSNPNYSPQSRRAFITSFMSAHSYRTDGIGDSRQRYFLVSGQTFAGCVHD